MMKTILISNRAGESPEAELGADYPPNSCERDCVHPSRLTRKTDHMLVGPFPVGRTVVVALLPSLWKDFRYGAIPSPGGRPPGFFLEIANHYLVGNGIGKRKKPKGGNNE